MRTVASPWFFPRLSFYAAIVSIRSQNLRDSKRWSWSHNFEILKLPTKRPIQSNISSSHARAVRQSMVVSTLPGQLWLFEREALTVAHALQNRTKALVLMARLGRCSTTLGSVGMGPPLAHPRSRYLLSSQRQHGRLCTYRIKTGNLCSIRSILLQVAKLRARSGEGLSQVYSQLVVEFTLSLMF